MSLHQELRQAEGKIAAENAIGRGGDEIDECAMAFRASGLCPGPSPDRRAVRNMQSAGHYAAFGNPEPTRRVGRAAEIDAENASRL
jgi:hypothetical protein